MKLVSAMLADGARLGQDGKLYVFGGQWDRIFAPTLPITQRIAFAMVVKVDYREAMALHQVALILVDADGQEVGPKIGGHLASGHPPGLVEGEPVFIPLAIEPPLIPLQSYGRFEWQILLDGELEEMTLPMSVVTAPTLPLVQQQDQPTD